MKRTATLGLLVSCLLFLLAGGSGFAQNAAQKAAPKAAEKKPSVHAWKTVADGIQVLDVQNPSGFKWPEIRVLQLSEDEFKKFDARPKDYLNDHKIFPKDVREVFVSHMPGYEKSKGKSGDDKTVLVMHDPGSTAAAISSGALP